MGERALKLMVILLCGVNSAMWLLYTHSPFMSAMWAGIAIGYIYWIADDIRRA